MKNRRWFTWVGLVLLATGLVVGFLEILERRFAEGGVYAHYASFRSDPLGVSAFYESVDALPSLEVSRNRTHLNQVKGLDSESVLLLLGYPRDGIDDLRAPVDSPVMEAVDKGARLVVTVNPGLVPEKFRPVQSDEQEDWFERRRKLQEEREARRQKQSEEAEEEEAEENGDRTEDPPEVGEASEDTEEEGDEKSLEEWEKELEKEMAASLGARLTDELGFELEGLLEFDRPEDGWEVEPGSDAESAPAAFPNWYSQFRFADLAKEWTIIAESEGGPVLIERKWGDGTIVLASDTYFVSNEALFREACPELLLWILGGKSKVVFDETIHGVLEAGGAMKLMRRYRVHGVFFGLLFVVCLWAWRSGSTLAPGSEELDRGLVGTGSQVSGEETEAGLTRLLRRSIAPSRLFPECVQVWSYSTRSLTPEQEKGRDEILERHLADPKGYPSLMAYRDMMALLRRR